MDTATVITTVNTQPTEETRYDTYEAPLYQCKTARLEWTPEGITAYYIDGERLMDELTLLTREREEITVDGRVIIIPEETEIWQAEFDDYYEALCAWVSGITGVSVETLRDAYHPDLNEPWIHYTR